jgi:hypothetical protein
VKKLAYVTPYEMTSDIDINHMQIKSNLKNLISKIPHLAPSRPDRRGYDRLKKITGQIVDRKIRVGIFVRIGKYRIVKGGKINFQI